MPGDNRVGVDRQPADRRTTRFRPAALVQVAAAHARGLHLDDDLAGTRGGIGKLHLLDLPLAREDNTAHPFLRFSRNKMKTAYALSCLPGTTLTPESCQ